MAASEVMALPYWLRIDVVALQEELSQLEASSMSQRTCLVGLVPGLLQTREYAGVTMEFNALPEDDQEAAVNARLIRQAIIQDPKRRLANTAFSHAIRASDSDITTLAEEGEDLAGTMRNDLESD
jgi:hypothetical protein